MLLLGLGYILDPFPRYGVIPLLLLVLMFNEVLLISVVVIVLKRELDKFLLLLFLCMDETELKELELLNFVGDFEPLEAIPLILCTVVKLHFSILTTSSNTDGVRSTG